MLYSYVQRIYFEGWFQVEHLKGNSDNSKNTSKGIKKVKSRSNESETTEKAEYMVLNKSRKSATK